MHRASTTLLLACILAAPAAAQNGSIRGRTTDSAGAPLARVVVTVEYSSLRAVSDERGEYLIAGVPSGTRQVRARLIGYVAESATATVPAGGEARVDFRLRPQPIGLAAIDVVVGSRARHTAAEELAVPVDVFTAEDLARQGSNETSQILQALSPSINFPRQSVTDATDIVRPFTLRGLSPDHTLVLLNGWRRHQTAVVNTFAYGTGAGSSGVDLNALPSSAIERVEVLRDGAAAQYGSDAIAGVVNVVTRESNFAPFVNATVGRYVVPHYADDGNTWNVAGGWGTRIGRGSVSLFAEVLNRQPTNRAWADPFEDAGGAPDSIDSHGQVVTKNNPVPQPNHHWGDGLERDVLMLGNVRAPLNQSGSSELYGFGTYATREGSGQGYRRYAGNYRNFAAIYPLGFLPEFRPDVTDYSATGGFRAATGGWLLDIGGTFGHNDFTYNLRNTLNTSLGPCLVTACAPGPDGVFGSGGDDPGIPNQTSFMAGNVRRQEMGLAANAYRRLDLGLPSPVSLAVGLQFRSESFTIKRGELASYIDGGHLASDSSDAPGGSQVFAGFRPSDEADASRTNIGGFLDLETNLSPQLLVAAAGRFESYSDFGERMTGKLALRFQPSPRVTLRAAGSTGFRAPGLGQQHFSKVVTNVIAGNVEEIGVFPVSHPASVALGAVPLKDETSVNLSAGLAVSPSDRLTLTLDVFRITIKDRILLGATFDDAFTVGLLTAAGQTGITGVQYFTNGLDTRTQGVDLAAVLRAGRIEFNGSVNYTKNDITSIDPLPAVMAGSTEPGLIDSVTYIAITEERPDIRATLSAQYSAGAARFLLRSSYYGGFASAQPGFCDRCREEYGAKTLFDAEVGYRFGRIDLAIGARNLLNTFPDQPSSTTLVDPADPTAGTVGEYNNNFGTFPWAAASPFGYNGRYVYVRVGVPLGR